LTKSHRESARRGWKIPPSAMGSIDIDNLLEELELDNSPANTPALAQGKVPIAPACAPETGAFLRSHVLSTAGLCSAYAGGLPAGD